MPNVSEYSSLDATALAEVLGWSTSTLHDRLRVLQSQGLIEIRSAQQGRIRRNLVYATG